jgi:hypothetical protein
MVTQVRAASVMTSIVMCLTACGPAETFVIRGYSGAPLVEKDTIRVTSSNEMFLDLIDGKKGEYIPLRSGPGVYRGFDLTLLPGKHMLSVYCTFYTTIYTEFSSDPITIPIDGQAGEHYNAICYPDGKQIRYEIRRVQ